MPAYGIMIPTKYEASDLLTLNLLRDTIDATRKAILAMVYAWALDKKVNKQILEKIRQK